MNRTPHIIFNEPNHNNQINVQSYLSAKHHHFQNCFQFSPFFTCIEWHTSSITSEVLQIFLKILFLIQFVPAPTLKHTHARINFIAYKFLSSYICVLYVDFTLWFISSFYFFYGQAIKKGASCIHVHMVCAGVYVK